MCVHHPCLLLATASSPKTDNHVCLVGDGDTVLPPHPNVLRFWGTMWDKIPDEAIPHLPLFVREQANYRDHAGKIQRRKAQVCSKPDHNSRWRACVLTHTHTPTLPFYVAQFIIVDYHPQSLQTHLKDLPNPLSFHYCLEIAVGLLRAVTHLERHRVAHLDLKTDNVLVANDGRIVVCDFGNAVQYATSAMELPFRTVSSSSGSGSMMLVPPLWHAILIMCVVVVCRGCAQVATSCIWHQRC